MSTLADDEEEEDWNYETCTTINRNSPEKKNFHSPSNKETPVFQNFHHRRTIIHIDIDCFYAQVEMIRKPELRELPIGIQQKNIMVTCNYKAREFGLTKLMVLKDAIQKCPQLVLVNGEDLTHYRQMSYNISELLLEYTPLVERLGFDENFLDVTELVEEKIKSGNYNDSVSGHMYQHSDLENSKLAKDCDCGCHVRLVVGSQIADEIRAKLNSHIHITCCAGIAHNKLLSKLVAGTHKPNQQTTLFPEEAVNLLNSLKEISKIPGIGWATSKRLNTLGVHNIQDLRDISSSVLSEELGSSVANTIQQLSIGIDDSPVLPYGKPQTLSDEDSFRKCCTVAEVQCKMHELLQNLIIRLIEDGRIPQTIRLTIRKSTLENKWTNRESRQCPIPSHIFSSFDSDTTEKVSNLLQPVLLALFKKLVNVSQPFHLTLINVAFSKLMPRPKNSISKFFSSFDIGKMDHNRNKEDKKVVNATSVKDYGGTESEGVEFCDNTVEPPFRNLAFKGTSSPFQKSAPDVSYSKRKIDCVTKDVGFFAKKIKSSRGNNIDSEGNNFSSMDSESDKHLINESQKSKIVSVELFKHTVSQSITPENRSSFVPDYIDENIFNELPLSIQEEIKAEFKNKSEKCAPDSKDFILSLEKLEEKCNSESVSDFHSEQGCSDLLSDSKEKGWSEAPQHYTNILPSHVDSHVFANLPPEIRAELLQQWKFVDKVIPNRAKSKFKPGKSPEKNKSKIKSANISSFFKKC